MSKENHNELDKLIADAIRSELSRSEEGYTHGAWEQFVAVRAARRRRALLRWSTTAAAILIAGWLSLELFLTNNPPILQKELTAEEPLSVQTEPVPHPQIETPAQSQGDKKRGSLPIKQKQHAILAENIEPIVFNLNTKVVSGKKGVEPQDRWRAKPIKRIYREEQTLIAQAVDREDIRSKVRLGMTLSSGFNSSSGNPEGGVNFSAGVSIDVGVAKGVEISTGVQYGKQSIEARAWEGKAAIPSTHTAATLTNIDIPVNIRLNVFSNNNSKYYISGGFSTVAFLTEEYKITTYRQELREVVNVMDENKFSTFRLENVTSVENITPPPSAAIDFAGRINLMIGYEQRVTNRLNLHIEPYVKLPLSGVGIRDIRYTTGGVTFKISF